MPYKDKEKNNEYQKKWQRVNTTDIDRRRRKLKMKYGLSMEEYDRMLVEQNGRCAICLKTFPSYLVVDHDHKNMKVRGLLCHHCNTGLGMFQDDIELLRRAKIYLDSFSG